MKQILNTKKEIKEWAEELPLVQQALPITTSMNELTLMIKVSLFIYIFYPNTMKNKIEKKLNELLPAVYKGTVKLTLSTLPGLPYWEN